MVENNNFVQIVPQTKEQMFEMYMRCTKEELARMLVERDCLHYDDSCTEPQIITNSLADTNYGN